MTKKRIATLATCLTLVGAVAVGGTLALLTAGPKSITNTFATSNGYDEDGEQQNFVIEEQNSVQNKQNGDYEIAEDAAWQSTGVPYHNLIADSNIDKNPRFKLQASDGNANPSASWVVAKMVPTQVEHLVDAGIKFDTVSSEWLVIKATTAEGVTTYQSQGNLSVDFLNNTYKTTVAGTEYYFLYKEQIDVDEDTPDIDATTASLFTKLTVDSTFNAETFNKANNAANLKIEGVAVQAMPDADVTDPETGAATITEIMTYAVPAFSTVQG